MKDINKIAGVYNRWFHTLGGGEQYAFLFAITLRDLGYRTYVLTHQYVDLKEAESKLNLDLHDISVRYLPYKSDKELSEYTSVYDVFINTSYYDYIPNKSKLGILSIFFPSTIHFSILRRIKVSVIIPFLRSFFIYPSLFDDMKVFMGKRVLGQHARMLFNVDALKKCSLTFKFEVMKTFSFETLHFFSNEEEINWVDRRVHVRESTITYTFKNLKNLTNEGIQIVQAVPQEGYIMLEKMSFFSFRNTLYTIFKHVFPKLEVRLHGGETITTRKDLESYQEIIAISSFTQSWITKLWNLKSTILYPPVHIKEFKEAKQKESMIISVGRFFVGGHSKKQLEMVQMFKKIYDLGFKDWKLVLLGRVAEGSIHSEYVEKVKHEAKGYPIEIITDVSSDVLKEKLSKAKIYWHATGLHEDEEKDPINMEHFGITTVEAMASGSVPIVINKGGQKEVVDSTCGFLWNNEDEWLEKTIRVMKDDQLCKQLKTKALEKSTQFSDDMFSKRFTEILSKHIQVK